MAPAFASRSQVAVLGCLFLLAIVLLVYSLAAVWPTPETKAAASPSAKIEWSKQVTWFWYSHEYCPDELRLLLIVIITAALGSYIHAVTSFTSYAGNRRLQISWVWWYILRGPIGVSLAIIFYCVVRGGLFSSGAVGTDMSPFGVAALSGLVGMFSKQASDKLRETFDNLFRTAPGKGDDVRADKLTPGDMIIKAVDPTGVAAGATGVTVKVQGANFAQGAIVLVNDAARQTDFGSATELVVHLEDGDTAAAGALRMVVKAAPPSDRQSNPITFDVHAF
jgi:hypothetical protein